MTYDLQGKSLKEQEEIINKAKKDSSFLGLMIQDNENLIWFTIHKYFNLENTTENYGVEKEDIFQVGNIAFIKAVKLFDTSKGYYFSTYAVPVIYREVKTFLRDCGGLIRPTRNACKVIYEVERHLKDKGYVDYDELQQNGVSRKEAEKAYRLGVSKVKSFEEFYSSESDGFIEEVLPDTYSLEDEVQQEIDAELLIDNIIDRLDELENTVFNKKVLEGKTHREIAASLDMKEHQILRIFAKVKNKAREAMLGLPLDENSIEIPSIYTKYLKAIECQIKRKPKSTLGDLKESIRSHGLPVDRLDASAIYYIKKRALMNIDKEST